MNQFTIKFLLHYRFLKLFLVFILFLGLVGCGSGKTTSTATTTTSTTTTTTNELRVTGIENDTTPRSSKIWSWDCSKPTCTFRFVITQTAQSFDFPEAHSYGRLKTKTINISNRSAGTYYLHVQAKDSDDNESDVTTVSATLQAETTRTVMVTGIADDITSKSSKTWTWDCNETPCTFRFAINQEDDHTFSATDSYNNTKRVTKNTSTGEGTYYLHVQAKDSAGNESGVRTVVFILENLTVTGIENDTTPRASKTWNWNCNSPPCTFRYEVNANSSHAFSSNQSYGSTKTKTIDISDPGRSARTYYLHVQAKANSNESPVKTVSFVLSSVTLRVTGLTNDTTPKRLKTWTWGCSENGASVSCTYRHVINQNATHNFGNARYNSTKTAEKSISSASNNGTYYLHVQAKANSNESPVKTVSVVLSSATLSVTGLTNDTTPKSLKTWTWNCSENGASVKNCTYRHVINKNATHNFGNARYNSTNKAEKRVSSASDNGTTYYLHVQAKNASGNESVVRTVSAVLQFRDSRAFQVTGLEDDPAPKRSKTWKWSCTDNSGACSYRFVINKSAEHDFDIQSVVQSYGSTINTSKTIASEAENGTYWLHVQARDTSSNESPVKSVRVDFSYETILVTSLSTSDRIDDEHTFNWSCDAGGCMYRHVVNTNADHIFDITDEYSTTTSKTISVSDVDYQSGTKYYIHVQAKDDDGNLSTVASASVTLSSKIINIAIDDPKRLNKMSVQWTWECDTKDDPVATKPCQYRYAVNQTSSHTFKDTDTYTSVTTATKTITAKSEDGDYYLHVQTRDANNNISNVKTSDRAENLKFELDIMLKDPTPHTDSDNELILSQLHIDKTPTFTVMGLPEDSKVRLYTSPKCADASAISSEGSISSTHQVDLTTQSLDHLKTYPIYISVKEPSNDSECYALVSDNPEVVDDETTEGNIKPFFSYTLYKPIVAGGDHTCYLSPMGEVYCWGDNADSSVTTPIGLGGGNQKARAIAAGSDYTCVILDDDSVECFDGSISSPTSLKAKAIAAGEGHACAILNDDSVQCWGSNDKGQLGLDKTTDAFTPTSVDLGCETTDCDDDDEKFKAKAIAAGDKHTCVIILDNNEISPNHNDKLLCWGANDKGQLGLNSIEDRGDSDDKKVSLTEFLDLGRSVRSVTAGENHTCGVLTNNTVKCWGHNILGQLGRNSVEDIGDDEVVDTSTISGISKYVVTGDGANHTCGVLSNDTLKCWGNNLRGALGQKDKIDKTKTDKTELDGSDEEISRDDDGFLNKKADSNITVNRNHGSGTGSDVPGTDKSNIKTVSRISAIDFGCRINVRGGGSSCSSQNRFKLKTPYSVAVGKGHTCAVLQTDQASDEGKEFVKCWGDNREGQLGDDTTDRETSVDKADPIIFSQ